MSEVTLVSWDRPSEHGKLPDSEWMCPIGSLDAVSDIEWAGGTVTDADVQALARGRRQHLELTTYPEGYHAAKVIDTQTGVVLTDEGRTSRYGGLLGCNCTLNVGAPDSGPCTIRPIADNVLAPRAIPLPRNRQLAGVYNTSEGTQTMVIPVLEPGKQPDYTTTMLITPEARKLFIATVTRGKIGGLACELGLDIRQENARVQGQLALRTSEGQLTLHVGPNGQAKSLQFCGPGLLRMFGVTPALEAEASPAWTTITDRRQQAHILHATAEALGMGGWQGLDLKLTASTLYANMGPRYLEPSKVLTPLV